MKYASGMEIQLGDKVKLQDGAEGAVVCCLDKGEYSPEYPEADWGYLKHGIMVQFPRYGLIHYAQPEAGLELIERSLA